VLALTAGASAASAAPSHAITAGARAALVRAPQPRGSKRVVPVFVQQLWAPLDTYRSYASTELGDISSELTALLSAEQAGDMAAARADWLAPHLHWLLIGQDDGAYGAFGALGRSIDGTAAGYVGGVRSAEFTGFHRIEYELWTADDLSAAAAQTTTLQALIAKLQRIGMDRELPKSATALQNWVLRAHEILEDADRDTLTGDDDYGSGTGVASVTADAQATAEILTLLKPVITPRAPKLEARCRSDLARIEWVADATRVDGDWVGITELPTLQREALDAAVGQATEDLAPISDIIHVLGAKL
jgi:iron uptake system EfeUOB component EfeO/EfeM